MGSPQGIARSSKGPRKIPCTDGVRKNLRELVTRIQRSSENNPHPQISKPRFGPWRLLVALPCPIFLGSPAASLRKDRLLRIWSGDRAKRHRLFSPRSPFAPNERGTIWVSHSALTWYQRNHLRNAGLGLACSPHKGIILPYTININ